MRSGPQRSGSGISVESGVLEVGCERDRGPPGRGLERDGVKEGWPSPVKVEGMFGSN